MIKKIIKTTFLTTITLTCLLITSCNNNSQNKKATDADESRPTSFSSHDDFLDFIQKSHLNYMWDGAEPTSGLAPERMHIDGVYPQDDADVITTGGSGFGV
ncbi:MAG TPA: hypothetical protein VKX35_06370, partial [Fermentimonas sp.]|nr:hypothetical protein [Fermentimonas sp.]